MQLAEDLAQEGNAHSQQGNPKVKCNALYKTRQNFNCLPTASQAIELAQRLLQKAHLILDNEIEDGVVHVCNQGEHNEKLYLGLNRPRKGKHRKETPRVSPMRRGARST